MAPIAIALLATAVALSACAAPEPIRPRNLVVITIDTLRADRIGRGVAPALETLAAQSVRFTNARTTAPLTLPAHTSLMTGTLPRVHGVHDNGVVVPDTLPTLAAVCRAAGYRTAAFVGAYVLDRRFGLARGFDTYDDRVARDAGAEARLDAERRAEDVVDTSIAWLDQTGSAPFLLWVHVYDPHAPYEAPGAPAGSPAAAYDAEVAYASAQIGRLLARLEAKGLRSSTVVAVAGDHGEGLGEHGEQTHGMLAYDSTLHVPLFVAAPGLPPHDVSEPVSLADVGPSLLRLAGVTGALSPLASTRDLFAPASGDVHAESEYPRAAGWHPLSVVADAQWKLILSAEPELYDMRTDRRETANQAASHRQVVQAMSARIKALPAPAPSGVSTLAPDAAAKLRALGYVGGAMAAPPVASAPNPSAVIDAWTEFEAALALVNGGDGAAAVGALRRLSTRFPDGAVFQSTYARALQESGQSRLAVTVLRAAIDRQPGNATLFHDLAVAARLAGDDAEALKAEKRRWRSMPTTRRR
jgi:choline-sulfatase